MEALSLLQGLSGAQMEGDGAGTPPESMDLEEEVPPWATQAFVKRLASSILPNAQLGPSHDGGCACPDPRQCPVTAWILRRGHQGRKEDAGEPEVDADDHGVLSTPQVLQAVSGVASLLFQMNAFRIAHCQQRADLLKVRGTDTFCAVPQETR